MAVTSYPYNHTTRDFAQGSNLSSEEYKVMLCTAVTFDASNLFLGDVTKIEVGNGNGYTTGGLTLTNVNFTTYNNNDCKFDADDAIWTATSNGITAEYGLLYNASNGGMPVLLFLDFGAPQTAPAGAQFKIVWSENGIISWVTT